MIIIYLYNSIYVATTVVKASVYSCKRLIQGITHSERHNLFVVSDINMARYSIGVDVQWVY